MAAKSRQRRQTTEHDDGDDHVDGVWWRLWTAATKGSTVHLQGDIWAW
jgi:hypothetical protein